MILMRRNAGCGAIGGSASIAPALALAIGMALAVPSGAAAVEPQEAAAPPFAPGGGPYVIAHRGGAGLGPENTLFAMARALALGVDGIEIDVQMTADREIIAYHDFRLDRSAIVAGGEDLPKGAPPIKDLTYAELRPLRIAGAEGGRRATAAPIPRLAEAIALIRAQGRGDERLWIEIKTDPRRPRIASDSRLASAAVLEVLEAEDFTDRADILSFDWTALESVRRAEPGLARVHLTLHPRWRPFSFLRMRAHARLLDGARLSDFGGSLPRAAASRKAAAWNAFHRDITPQKIRIAQEAGLLIGAWTVNDPERARELVAMGVDAITTDYPDRMLAALRDRRKKADPAGQSRNDAPPN